MAWYDDLWGGIKSAVGDVADVVGKVAPLVPLFLKKGGSVSDFKDTPANRRKIINLYKKINPHHKAKVDAYLKSKKVKNGKRGRPAKK